MGHKIFRISTTSQALITGTLSHRARWLFVVDTELFRVVPRRQKRSARNNILFVEILSTDNSKEFIKRCQERQWTHDQPCRRKSCSTSKRRNSDSDASERRIRSMVAMCDGMFLQVAQRAQLDEPLILLGAKVRNKPHLFERRGKAASSCPPGETLSKMKKWRRHNLAVSHL